MSQSQLAIAMYNLAFVKRFPSCDHIHDLARQTVRVLHVLQGMHAASSSNFEEVIYEALQASFAIGEHVNRPITDAEIEAAAKDPKFVESTARAFEKVQAVLPRFLAKQALIAALSRIVARERCGVRIENEKHYVRVTMTCYACKIVQVSLPNHDCVDAVMDDLWINFLNRHAHI